jgi:hypothetical protein
VIATRGAVGDVELETLKAAGFTEQAALEVVLGVSRLTRWHEGSASVGRNRLDKQALRHFLGLGCMG